MPPSCRAGIQLRRPPCLSYRRVVTYRYWPLFDLRLSTPDLRLRPMAEADLAVIGDLMLDGFAMGPGLATYEFDAPRLGRGVLPRQLCWRACGTWRPQAWRLSFVVRSAAGEILGVQELEGNEFPTLRTVDSSSF